MRASAGTSLRSCAERGKSTLHPHALALTGAMIMRAIRKLMLRLWTTSTNGECKYHAKPVDVAVYAALQEKGQSKELAAAFKSYEVVYGLFSKSGFTDRLVEMAAENTNLILIQEDAVYKK